MIEWSLLYNRVMNVLELRVTDSHTVQLNHQNYSPMDQILRVAAFHTPSETQIGG